MFEPSYNLNRTKRDSLSVRFFNRRFETKAGVHILRNQPLVKGWARGGALLAVLTMGLIIFYLIESSLPAFLEINAGLFDPDSEWRPRSANPSYNILPMILADFVCLLFGSGHCFALRNRDGGISEFLRAEKNSPPLFCLSLICWRDFLPSFSVFSDWSF